MKEKRTDPNIKIVQFPCTTSEENMTSYEPERKDIRLEIEQLRHKAFDRYCLAWMLDNDISLRKFANRFMLAKIVADCARETPLSVNDAYDEWESNTGFCEGLWMTEEDFMNEIYVDAESIAPFIRPEEQPIWEADACLGFI